MLLPGLAVAHNGADGNTAATRSPEAVHQHGKTKTDDTAKTSGSTKTPEVKAARITPAELCTRMTTFSGKTEGDTDTRFKELGTNFAGRSGKLNQNAADLAARIAASRAQADAERQERFAKLLARPPMTPRSRIFWPSRRP
jgi:hypothetical protein